MSVYFIQAEMGGPIKIGYAADEFKRFATIQTGYPDKLVLCHAIVGDIETERAIHNRFRKCRLRGEWFYPTPELVKFARAKADLTGFWAKQMELVDALVAGFASCGDLQPDAILVHDALDVAGLLLVDREES